MRLEWGQIDQWNSLKSSEIDPYINGQLIFCKDTKAVSLIKTTSMNCAKMTGYPYKQKLNHDPYFTPHTRK